MWSVFQIITGDSCNKYFVPYKKDLAFILSMHSIAAHTLLAKPMQQIWGVSFMATSHSWYQYRC
jgi:hypothetical protein